MNRLGGLKKFLVPLGGVGALLQGATLTATQSNNPPLREYVTSSDVGHPHATTRKNHIQDKMEQNPTVLKSPFEWPRTPSIEQNRSMSAHEATLKQAESVRNMRKTHREMTSKQQQQQQQSKQSKQQRKQHKNKNKQEKSTPKTENQKNSRMTKIEIEGDIQVELKDKIEKNIAEAQAQAQVQESLQLGLNSGEFEVADYIDHTALKAFVSKDDIKNLCEEAIKHNFVSVCVNPVWVEYCSQLLKNTNVKVCTVIGFPLGANTTKMKALEALQAVQDGATEIDMVISVGNIKSKEWDLVELEVASVVQVVQGSLITSSELESIGMDIGTRNKDDSDNDNDKVIVKVILETCMLTKEEIVKACKICVRCGADYVKTSTGFGGGGATLENVRLMKETVEKELLKENRNKNECKVKASGGIRDFQSAKEMIKAGASRLGTSSGIKIVLGSDDVQNDNTQTSGGY